MKAVLATALLVGLGLTARGDQIALSTTVNEGMTPIDTLPDPAYLDSQMVFGNTTSALDGLVGIATLELPSTPDFGVQLRAIRTLPTYCPTPCGAGTPAHDTLAGIVDAYGASGTPTAKDVLRLRAAIEALGVAGRSAGLDADVTRIVQFLGHASQDVRATAARALGTLCNTQASAALRARLSGNVEPSPQVQLALSAALRDLGPGQCTK